MSRLTKRVISFVHTDGKTDPNYRKVDDRQIKKSETTKKKGKIREIERERERERERQWERRGRERQRQR